MGRVAAGDAARPALTPELKFRAVSQIINEPRGLRGLMTRRLAKELKRAERSLHRWKAAYLTGGYPALERRRRSDAGHSKLYSGEQWRAIEEVAPHVRRGQLRRTFLALLLPGSYEAFRETFWQIRRGASPGGLK